MSECIVCGRTRRGEPHPYCDAIEAELHALRDVAAAALDVDRRIDWSAPFTGYDEELALHEALATWQQTAAPIPPTTSGKPTGGEPSR